MTHKKLKIAKNDKYDRSLSVKVTHKVEDEINSLARLNNCSVSDIIRTAIYNLIDNILYP